MRTLSAASAKDPRPSRAAVPTVVGVGASAGGLEAVSALLSALPPDTGAAYVIVQHLDPDRPSLLPSLLARDTTMPVHQVEEGMRLERSHVYVIPPTADVIVGHGMLHLSPRHATTGRHLPIDGLFASLAADRGPRAVGVVLSGTGADGTDGLSAIKSRGGVTFAQQPDSAGFRGMPDNAISAHVVDVVDTPAGIGESIARLVGDGTGAVDISKSLSIEDRAAVDAILAVVKKRARIDFTQYKQATVVRRIRRRAMLSKAGDLAAYAAIVAENDEERSALGRDLLIMVTTFFREPEAFQVLQDVVFPAIVDAVPSGEKARMWVVGCGTGQEAYSLMIAFDEYLTRSGRQCGLQVFASDASEPSIAFARSALYPASVADEVGPDRLSRYFEEAASGYRVRTWLREQVVFAAHDVTSEPPFSRLHFVSCRNLMIYFSPALQRRALATFHFALLPGGYLLLGPSESVSASPRLFDSIDARRRVFVRSGEPASFPTEMGSGTSASPPLLLMPPTEPAPDQVRGDDLSRQMASVLLARLAQAAVVVGPDMQVLHVHGAIGPYLQPPQGKATHDVLSMAREGLAGDLREAMTAALSQRECAKRIGVRMAEGGGHLSVEIEAIPLSPLGDDQTLLVTFRDLPPDEAPGPAGPAPAEASEAEYLRKALSSADATIKALRQDMEVAIADLRGAVEEGQSGNEELQSMNEELQTAEEELQSTNEELTTLNDELRARAEILASLNSDLDNLLSSVNVPTVMLDRELRVRRFTADASPLLNLIPSDVGRPLTDIRPTVDVPDLPDILRSALEGRNASRREVIGPDGRWRSMIVTPYLSMSGEVDGAVLSLVDIDDIKQAQVALEHANALAVSLTTIATLLNSTGYLEPTMVTAVEDARAAIQADSCMVVLREGDRWRVRFRTGETTYLKTEIISDSAVRAFAPAALSGTVVVRPAGRTGRWAQVGALVSAPVLLKGSPVGAVTFSWKEREPGETETDFVTRFAVAVAVATESENRVDELAALVDARTEELKATAVDLQRALQTKDVFLASMSHELRTPLNSIIGFSGVMLQGLAGELGEEQRRQLTMVKRSGDQLLALVNGLLDLSAIESGGTDVVVTDVDVEAVVHSVHDLMAGAAADAGQQLEVALGKNVPHIRTDEGMLRQIVSNLVGNAAKFAGPGRVVIKAMRASKDRVAISVRDTGPGIPADVLPHVAEAFRQFSGADEAKPAGVGLGLAISSRLATVLGGDLTAESVLGEGSTFTLMLPVAH